MEFDFRWIVDLDGAPGTLYAGESLQLLFKFGSRYPFDSPQVSTVYTWTPCLILLVEEKAEHRYQSEFPTISDYLKVMCIIH